MEITLSASTIKEEGNLFGYSYDELRITPSRISDSETVTLSAMRNGKAIRSVQKGVQYDSGNVSISLKGKRVTIGTYKQIEKDGIQ